MSIALAFNLALLRTGAAISNPAQSMQLRLEKDMHKVKQLFQAIKFIKQCHMHMEVEPSRKPGISLMRFRCSASKKVKRSIKGRSSSGSINND